MLCKHGARAAVVIHFDFSVAVIMSCVDTIVANLRSPGVRRHNIIGWVTHSGQLHASLQGDREVPGILLKPVRFHGFDCMFMDGGPPSDISDGEKLLR